MDVFGLLSQVNDVLSDGMPSTEPVRDPVLDYDSREQYGYNDSNMADQSQYGASGDPYEYYTDVNAHEHTIHRELNEDIYPDSSMENLDNSDRVAYQCIDCDKCFARKDQLERHSRIHSTDKQYKCSTCGECFAIKHDWKQHKKIHFREDYQCKYCEKFFTHKKSMIEHQKVHTMEKCNNCDLFFDNKEDLVVHQATHIEEKPHQCSVCGKCFGFKSHLERHQRVHTKDNVEQPQIPLTENPTHQAMHKEKSFQCTQCGKSYTSMAILDRHQITHTGEKPFECIICGRRFGYNSHLERHMKVHSKTKKKQ